MVVTAEILRDQFCASVGQENVYVLDLPTRPPFGIVAVEIVAMNIEYGDKGLLTLLAFPGVNGDVSHFTPRPPTLRISLGVGDFNARRPKARQRSSHFRHPLSREEAIRVRHLDESGSAVTGSQIEEPQQQLDRKLVGERERVGKRNLGHQNLL